MKNIVIAVGFGDGYRDTKDQCQQYDHRIALPAGKDEAEIAAGNSGFAGQA